jgi:RTC4-like domain
MSLFPPSFVLTEPAFGPLTLNLLVDHVLLPHVATTLISQDLNIPEKQAYEVMEASIQFGEAVHPDDDDDDDELDAIDHENIKSARKDQAKVSLTFTCASEFLRPSFPDPMVSGQCIDISDSVLSGTSSTRTSWNSEETTYRDYHEGQCLWILRV